MREPSREVVVTGVGVCCHLGDDLEAILDDLKAGRSTPFPFYQEGAEAGARCQLAGAYHGDLSNQALGIDKTESRFMGRAALLALKATRRALAQSQLARRDLAVVVGAGTGDVATHRDIQAKLDIPWSTLSHHLERLASTGLLKSRPEGRFIYYRADYAALRALTNYLWEDCCKGGGPSCC